MRILVDINHPAHVHLFKNFIFEMKGKGHDFFVTVKHIPAATRLLDKYNIKYINIGIKSDSLKGKIWNQFRYDISLFHLVRKYKITIGLGSSVTLAQVSRLTSMKSFVFDDDDSAVQPLFVKFAHPFADYLVSPDVLSNDRKKKSHIVYPGYHELAYLYPKRFNPNPEVLKDLALKPGDVFFILRFNAFKAHHDRGGKGFSLEQKRKLINILEKHGKIYITTEGEIESEFSKYQLKISPEKIHSLLYYALMFIGDSQTMTSEAAVLGTPAIKCNTFAGKLSVPNEIERKYKLCYSFLNDNENKMIDKVKELIATPDIKEEWQTRRKKMLAEKIDVTAFMVWLIENYPQSIKIIKENPEYQERFK